MVNIYDFPRGTICVLRSFGNLNIPLAIPQAQYAEWVGCFSLL